MLADVFDNFRNMCFEIYELEPSRFDTAPALAWQAAFKTQVKLDTVTDIDMLLMIEQAIRRGVCCPSIANNNCMKDYDKNKESPYLKYWEVNNLYG